MALEDFERLPSRYSQGTSKILSRSALTADEDVGSSAGDFLGRLITLFGPLDGDGVTLRHRPTGIVITAYSSKSGPSYGGGVCYPGALPPEPRRLTLDERVAAQERVAAATSQMPSASEFEDLSAFLRALAVLEQKLADVRGGAGYLGVVTELESLLAAAPLTDHERVDDELDEGPYRLGVRGGEPFIEKLTADEALAFHLSELRRADGFFLAFAVTRAFLALRDLRGRKASMWLPELQRVWSELADRVSQIEDPGARRRLWEALAEHADTVRADAAARERLRSVEPTVEGRRLSKDG
jgi:hypothetical protein